jgi:hypothetical protein
MLRLAPGAIPVSRGLSLEAGMANSLSSDPRKAPVVVRQESSSATIILPSQLRS